MADAQTGVNLGYPNGHDSGAGAMTTNRFDLPTPEGETIEFWKAAKEERLLIRHCTACQAYSYYPRPFCPKCWSEDVEWFEASGKGTLYTWSVIYSNDMPPFNERVPYVAAMVDLAEGPRMTTNVVECPFDELEVGMPLRVIFRPISDDFSIPVFVRE